MTDKNVVEIYVTIVSANISSVPFQLSLIGVTNKKCYVK